MLGLEEERLIKNNFCNFMGKKKIKKITDEDLIKERDAVEDAAKHFAAKSQAGTGKGKKICEYGCAYINSTYNNTVVTITDHDGNVLTWSSAGSLRFKGPKKSTPFAASKVIEAVSGKIKTLKMRKMDIFVKGVGGGRDAAIKSLVNCGLEIIKIKDVTPIPHNGCRPPKPRRI